MTPIVDAFPYPWPDPAAQELHVVLAQIHNSPQAALMVAQAAGIDTLYIDPQQAVIFVWHDILDAAATGGLTRTLVTTVHDRLAPTSPRRPFLAALLADETPAVTAEPRRTDGTPVFLAGDDSVSEREALLYRDDLTLQIGRVPALILTLQRLVELASSVCRLVVDVHGKTMLGSGFRIADDLILTNWHVLHLPSDGTRATAVSAEFAYEDDGTGGVLPPIVIPCAVDSILADKTDDWGVIRAMAPLRADWAIVRLSEAVDPAIGGSAFIVQHPGGERKRLGFVRNQVSSFDARLLYYLTDTQSGSSGSPVFNSDGQLIGLHHAGGTPQQKVGKPPLAKNEGIRIPRVLAGLDNHNVPVP
jgi:S1-C subfamily serine protease